MRGPNYIADRGSVRVDGDGAPHVMFPEKRRYLSGGNVMTEAAIEPGVTRDVYVAMGEPLPEGGWTLRLHYAAGALGLGRRVTDGARWRCRGDRRAISTVARAPRRCGCNGRDRRVTRREAIDPADDGGGV